MTEGQLVGPRMANNIIRDIAELANVLRNYNPYPESGERVHISDEAKALMILQFQELQRAMEEKFPEAFNSAIDELI